MNERKWTAKLCRPLVQFLPNPPGPLELQKIDNLVIFRPIIAGETYPMRDVEVDILRGWSAKEGQSEPCGTGV
jgi:hypothetical protein